MASAAHQLLASGPTRGWPTLTLFLSVKHVTRKSIISEYLQEKNDKLLSKEKYCNILFFYLFPHMEKAEKV